MEWTTERRYRRYEDWTQEEIKTNQRKYGAVTMAYKLSHRTKQGLLNDPNGFSYFDGKWIVFYQNFPLVQPTV